MGTPRAQLGGPGSDTPARREDRGLRPQPPAAALEAFRKSGQQVPGRAYVEKFFNEATKLWEAVRQMGPSLHLHDEPETQQTLRQLFNAAAAMSLAVVCRLDAEPEMARFVAAVKAHPEQRAFVVKLFIESFSESFHMRHAPTDFLMYSMSDLRWQEIREFIMNSKREDNEKHGVSCYAIWHDILEAFENGWRSKYFQDFTNKSQ